MSLDIDLRSLLKRLNRVTSRALNTAAGSCAAREQEVILPDHLLAALLDEAESDVPRILRHFEIDEGRLRKQTTSTIESIRGGYGGKPRFSEEVLDWLQAGWLHSSIDLGQPELRSGGLMLTLASRGDRFLATDYMDLLSPLSAETLRKEFDDIVAGSGERPHGGFSPKAATPADRPAGTTSRSPDSALGRFTIDLTAQARAGKIDPIFGRNREIRQMVDILGRRRKNNPMVVGEAGVGKTAVVEGLALKIVEGDIPSTLKDVDVLTLDLGLLQAGAGMRGEFEDRLKSVIDEVKGSDVPIILFIDEAHAMIGAGGPEGGGDAANLLKPALARGELRTVAATTWAEYKKYFETDAALSRRFQPVRIDEPDEEATAVMLRGLKSRYEEAHGVTIRDEGVLAAIGLSSRYIAGRQLPDKAVDLLDTCAARVKVAQAARPAKLEDLTKRVAALERERDALRRDAAEGAAVEPDRVDGIEQEIESCSRQAADLEQRWQAERDAAEALLAARGTLSEAPEDAGTKAKLDEAAAALEAVRDGDPLVPTEVDPEVVARTVSDWTGVPLGTMVRDQAKSVLDFEERMADRIKGQDHALRVVGEALRAAKAGIGNPGTPMGVFLFVGPSGVGKTETALGIADLLFGGERYMTTVNMSEFQEKHTVSLLKGSPPGYVGYGEGGVLTEPVRQRPYSVVLLDEVEKAHPDVTNLFYQVFDKGVLTDGTGRDIDYKNTIVVLTSNLGTDTITSMCTGPVPPEPDELAAAVKPAIVAHFKPALNARWTVVPFLTIGPEVMKQITLLKLDRIGRRLQATHGIEFGYEDAVVDRIVGRCTEVDTGARNVDHVVRTSLLPKIASGILERMMEGNLAKRLVADVGDDGGFSFRWENESGSPKE